MAVNVNYDFVLLQFDEAWLAWSAYYCQTRPVANTLGR